MSFTLISFSQHHHFPLFDSNVAIWEKKSVLLLRGMIGNRYKSDHHNVGGPEGIGIESAASFGRLRNAIVLLPVCKCRYFLVDRSNAVIGCQRMKVPYHDEHNREALARAIAGELTSLI